ncbi:hypothetical protein LINPERHAP1_LOCUS390, partial [Linum perenne]
GELLTRRRRRRAWRRKGDAVDDVGEGRGDGWRWWCLGVMRERRKARAVVAAMGRLPPTTRKLRSSIPSFLSL